MVTNDTITEVNYLGVTNSPSDYKCKDGELAYTENLVIKDGTFVAADTPDVVLNESGQGSGGDYLKPIFRHDTTSQTNWIFWASTSLYYKPINRGTAIEIFTDNNAFDLEPKQVTAMGNTLIFVTSDGNIFYVVWENKNNSGYKSLGTHIPELQLQFELNGTYQSWHSDDEKFDITLPDTEKNTTESSSLFMTTDSNKAYLTSRIFSKIEEFNEEFGYSANKFSNSFLIRYALRLYDGTYTNHSSVIYMNVNSGTSPVVYAYDTDKDNLSGNINGFDNVSIEGVFADLLVKKMNGVFSGWGDIVKGVDIFVSKQFSNYNVLGNIKKITRVMGYTGSSALVSYMNNPASLFYTANSSSNCTENSTSSSRWRRYIDLTAKPSQDNAYMRQIVLPYTSEDSSNAPDTFTNEQFSNSQMDEIKRCSNFYLLKSYNYDGTNDSWEITDSFTKVPVNDNLLKIIETQKTLPDEYFSHDTLQAKASYIYNSRLNLANISRKVFKGFGLKEQMPYVGGEHSSLLEKDSVRFHVFINENGMNVEALSNPYEIYKETYTDSFYSSMVYGLMPQMFYYPNPNANVVVLEVSVVNADGTLGEPTYYKYDNIEQHPTLNGSIIFNRNLTESSGTIIGENELEEYQRACGTLITHTNQVYTSRAYNPYAFDAKSINQIDLGGEILNFASTTEALSQGQFGQFPLYLFASSGVWAMELGSDGNFSKVTPVTRDVICGDGESLTQLDNSLVFATERGIMELRGSTTRCLSDDMEGKTDKYLTSLPSLNKILAYQDPEDFKTFIKTCRIVYDYVNQRLILFNQTADECYIYDMENKAWMSLNNNTWTLADIINCYPDAYAVSGDATTGYSILDLASISDNESESGLTGSFITRPIDMGMPNEFKVVDYVRQNGLMNPISKVEGGGITESTDEYGHNFGAYTSSAIQQILYGSNDLKNWFVVSSSQSQYINNYSGQAYKWFRLAVKCSLAGGDNISSVTFSWRNKFKNERLF